MPTIKQITSARKAQTERGLQIVILFADGTEVWFSAEYVTKKLASIGATIDELIAAPGNYQFLAEFVHYAAGSTFENKAGETKARKNARDEASKVEVQLTPAGAIVKQIAASMMLSMGLSTPQAAPAATTTVTEDEITVEVEEEIEE